ncbi:MAG: hypothetical protein ABSG00_05590 [Terracidiphilus sp.]
MMKKAGGAFCCRESPSQIVRGKIFDGKTWLGENNLSVGGKAEEEAKHLAVCAEVVEALPKDTPKPQNRPCIREWRGVSQPGGTGVGWWIGINLVNWRAMQCHAHLAINLGRACQLSSINKKLSDLSRTDWDRQSEKRGVIHYL